MENKNFKKPPVVVVMGHVDAGKTSILDYIRRTKVAEKEAGGITQHIGAYQIDYKGNKITFLDTPGHEAFNAMRSRGAKVADIAVLVVGADEGVKPQTKEAIEIIKKEGLPMIVAINKIDKPGADIEKVKSDLAQHGVLLEGYGGDVSFAATSAKTGHGIDELLELIILAYELSPVNVSLEGELEGVIIEATKDSKKGNVATVLIRNGVLRIGDIIGTKSAYAKVKMMEDFTGMKVKEVLPGMPVLIFGFKNLPAVGDKVKRFNSQQEAESYIKKKERKEKEINVLPNHEGKKVINIVLKADVEGSLDALEYVLKGIKDEEVLLRIIKKGVGEATDKDAKIADAGNAIIFAFRTKISKPALNLIDAKKIKVYTADVIYDFVEVARKMIDDIKKPKEQRIDLGKLKVLVVFMTKKQRQIIGCRVLDGEVRKGVRLEILRDGEVIGEGKLISLEKNKQDIGQAKKGDEVGILYEGNVKIEVGDEINVYYIEK